MVLPARYRDLHSIPDEARQPTLKCRVADDAVNNKPYWVLRTRGGKVDGQSRFTGQEIVVGHARDIPEEESGRYSEESGKVIHGDACCGCGAVPGGVWAFESTYHILFKVVFGIIRMESRSRKIGCMNFRFAQILIGRRGSTDCSHLHGVGMCNEFGTVAELCGFEAPDYKHIYASAYDLHKKA